MKIKNFLLFSMGLITLVTATSFKQLEKKRKFVGSWFVYTGSQSSGIYASLADAQNRSNWAYSTNPVSVSGSNYLKGIYVDFLEVDDMETVDFTDDKPMVDISSTNIHNVLTSARNTSTGYWSDYNSGSSLVEAGSTH